MDSYSYNLPIMMGHTNKINRAFNLQVMEMVSQAPLLNSNKVDSFVVVKQKMLM